MRRVNACSIDASAKAHSLITYHTENTEPRLCSPTQDATKDCWKSWLGKQTGSVRRGHKDVEGWLKHKRVRDHQAMLMITVELHLQDYKRLLGTWPFTPLSIIIDAEMPKSLYTRYAQAKAATKIQARHRGLMARKASFRESPAE